MNSLASAHRITSPISTSSSEPCSYSQHSSPFVLSVLRPITSSSTSVHAPLTSPLQRAAQLQEPTSNAPTFLAVGEIGRMQFPIPIPETNIAQTQEAESRQPENSKRSKHSISDADPTVTEAIKLEEREMGLPGVFDKSLTAGGYGLYVSLPSYTCID